MRTDQYVNRAIAAFFSTVREAIDEQRRSTGQLQIDDWAHYERSTWISHKHETELDETPDLQKWSDYQHRSGRY